MEIPSTAPRFEGAGRGKPTVGRARRHLPAVLLLLLTVAPSVLRGRDGDADRGFSGGLIVRGDRILVADHADRLFVPGSVQKLLVTAATLHLLGPDHRLRTTLHAAGTLGEGVLEGDLVLRAGGDPTWNRRFFPDDPRAPLRRLARDLRRRGVRRVTGALVIDLGRFPGRSFPVSRPASEAAYAYAAPASGLAVDENAVAVEIAPGRRVGDPGSVRLLDPGAGLELVNDIRTVPRERHDRGTVDFLPDWGSPRIVVRGEYPVSEPPYRVELSHPAPELHAAEVLRGVLADEGIAVDRVRLGRSPVDAGEPVAVLPSPPLAELLPVILGRSHNWYAEMLLRILAAETGGEGRIDDGLGLVAGFLRDQVGVDDGFVLDDGSGLSPYNLLTPRTVVELLRWVLRQPWYDLYAGALAAPGQGTLKVWGQLPPVAAKSGSIRHTVALAGYLDPDSPVPVLFARFLNHRDEEGYVLRSEIVRWLRRQSPTPAGH